MYIIIITIIKILYFLFFFFISYFLDFPFFLRSIIMHAVEDARCPASDLALVSPPKKN